MATSEQSPPAALLRLRASDVVRFCGLHAAATGLELASSHRVVVCRRDGNRLLAEVTSEPPYVVWVEVTDAVESVQWSCNCAHSTPLACEHVAATLSAWIAHPSDFIAQNTEKGEEPPIDPPDTPDQPSASDTISSDVAVASTEPVSLSEALSRMNVSDFDVIARRILGPDTTATTPNARHSIVATLSDSVRLQALLQRLEPPARMLFALIDLAGGAMTAADLEELAIRIIRPLSAVQGDVAVLERHALLLPMLPSNAPSRHGPGSTWRHVAGWRIPEEVRRSHTETLPLDAMPTQNEMQFAPPLADPTGAPLHVIRSAPRSLCLALALLAHAPSPLGPPRVVATTDDSTAPTRQGKGALIPGELAPERLRELARNAGIEIGAARLARRVLHQSREQRLAPSIVDIARVPLVERPLVLRTAFRHWLRADSATELFDFESSTDVRVCYAPSHPAFHPATIANEVSGALRFLARLLSRALPETWFALNDLISLAWQIRPGFLRGQQQTWATPAWWLESKSEKRPLQPQARVDWLAAEGGFIRSVLTGAFATWGAVDLATRENGAVVAFRLTPFGAFLLQRDNVQADASLVALCDADWGPPVLPLREGTLAVQPLAAHANLLDALTLWATPTAVSGKRLIYTFSPDRASAAFDQQLAPSSLSAILQPLHSRAAESVACQLNQWHNEWGRTRIVTGFTLLEASDEATLVEALAASPEIAARCRRIGPALALALPDDAAKLRSLLARRGYTV